MRAWQAKWIWPVDHRDVNGHVLFRKDFTLSEKVETAQLHIAVESFARVFVNGAEVCRTSSISYPGQHYYETVDVADALVEGVNRVAVLAWYIGVPSGASCPKDPGLLCEIVDGAEQALVATDASWRVRPLDAWIGRQRRSHWYNLDLIEILDFRKLPEDFPMVADLGDFAEPEVTNYPGARFITVESRPFPKPTGDAMGELNVITQGIVADRSGEFSRPTEAVVAETIDECDLGLASPADFTIQPPGEGRAATIVIDLGTYEKGLYAFEAAGCEGAAVDVSWYEHLKALDPKQTVSKVYTADRFILSADANTVVPEEWKCGRYLQLTFRNVTAPLRVTNLRWQRLHYPLTRKVEFRSSDPKLNRIFEISLNAAALCMHDNIMDCPWRERRQWIGDAQRIGIINHYAFGDRDLVRGVLRQHVRLQDPCGRMWVCLPVFEEYPSQSMEWLRAVLEYQQYTGDTTLVEELADNIEMLHRWFDSCRDEAGLLFIDTPPVMNWMDNPFGSVVTPSGSIRDNQFNTAFAALNLRYLLFLDDVAACMRQVGKDAVAARAQAERKRLAESIMGNFLDEETGLLRECADADIEISHSELAHALAVLVDLPGVDCVELWDRFEAYRAGETANVVAAGPFGMYQTHEALGKMGRTDELIANIFRGWGPMVDAGTDTTWEHFNGAGSQCHGWAGVPVVALMRHVFKLDPNRPGSARVENLGGLAWMECRVLG